MGQPSYPRAFLALFGAAFLTLFIGVAFLATPLNPAAVRIFYAKVDLAAAEQRDYSDVERDARFSSPRPPDPPFWVALLDWHAWLLVPTLVLTLSLLRPGITPTLVASGVFSALIGYMVAPAAAMFLLTGAIGGLLAIYLLSAIQNRKSGIAA